MFVLNLKSLKKEIAQTRNYMPVLSEMPSKLKSHYLWTGLLDATHPTLHSLIKIFVERFKFKPKLMLVKKVGGTMQVQLWHPKLNSIAGIKRA